MAKAEGTEEKVKGTGGKTKEDVRYVMWDVGWHSAESIAQSVKPQMQNRYALGALRFAASKVSLY